jgi:hypothetical protein
LRFIEANSKSSSALTIHSSIILPSTIRTCLSPNSLQEWIPILSRDRILWDSR